MVSQLGPLFRTMFRQAESADARLEIRREEKEHRRKKEDDVGNEDADNAMWEDSMAVSIDALRGFLMEFLKNHGAAAPAATISSPVEEASPPSERTPVSDQAARAAKAYGSMYAQTHTPPPAAIPLAAEPPLADNINPADLLGSSEIRAIHTLIADLDTLSKQGYSSLSIVMIGTFLESLAEAVRLVKRGGATS